MAFDEAIASARDFLGRPIQLMLGTTAASEVGVVFVEFQGMLRELSVEGPGQHELADAKFVCDGDASVQFVVPRTSFKYGEWAARGELWIEMEQVGLLLTS
jgi:hypothetical protein